VAKIKFRRDAAATWTDANPVLAQGEPRFEYNTGKLKIGDGVNPWNSLNYVSGGASGGSYILPMATPNALGGVRVDGTTILINSSGIIRTAAGSYILPTASPSTLGGVRVDGTTILINSNGVISAVGGGAGGIGVSGNTTNSVTFNNSGNGAFSGTTFNGSSAIVVSYNSVGAPSVTGAGSSGIWPISVTGTATNLQGNPNIVVSSIAVGSTTNSITSEGSNIYFGNKTVVVVPSVGFSPVVDNAYVLGGPSQRWAGIYAASGSIQTSDSRLKEQGRSLNDAEKAVAIKIKSLIKAFKFKDSVSKKGNQARIHIGVYAQEIKQAFESEGLVAQDYGMFCYDEYENGDTYGIRYEELLAFVISAI